jgi:hypothetical protein
VTQTDNLLAVVILVLIDTDSGDLMSNSPIAKRSEPSSSLGALRNALARAKSALLSAAKRLIKTVFIPMIRFILARPIVRKLPIGAVLRHVPWLHNRLRGMASRAGLVLPTNLYGSTTQRDDFPMVLTDGGRRVYLDLKSQIANHKAKWGD